MTPKELKKLASACRAAGILTFKNSEVEFTLSEQAPPKLNKNTQKSSSSVSDKDEDFTTETLTDEQMLFYSTVQLPEDAIGSS